MTAPPDNDPAWTRHALTGWDHPETWNLGASPPTTFDLRQAEMWDCRGQGPGPAALWTATTIKAPEYL